MNSPEVDSYEINRLAAELAVDAVWNKPGWERVPALSVGRHMGEAPAFMPVVEAKMGYTDDAIRVIFQVHDCFVQATITEYQGPVSRDSCVEFFFTPGNDIAAGYFNLEVNCCGTALFAYQTKPKIGRVNIPAAEFSAVEIATSIKEPVFAESARPLSWTMEACIPFAVLAKYVPLSKPVSGTCWLGNLYKVASKTSNPHYLTWAHVDHPHPQFHLPEFFGRLAFA